MFIFSGNEVCLGRNKWMTPHLFQGVEGLHAIVQLIWRHVHATVQPRLIVRRARNVCERQEQVISIRHSEILRFPEEISQRRPTRGMTEYHNWK